MRCLSSSGCRLVGLLVSLVVICLTSASTLAENGHQSFAEKAQTSSPQGAVIYQTVTLAFEPKGEFLLLEHGLGRLRQYPAISLSESSLSLPAYNSVPDTFRRLSYLLEKGTSASAGGHSPEELNTPGKLCYENVYYGSKALSSLPPYLSPVQVESAFFSPYHDQ